MDYVKRDLDSIGQWLEEQSSDDLVNMWNDMARENGSDDEIFSNDDEFFEVFFTKPMDAVRAAIYGSYEYIDEWVKFNGYANLETTNTPEDWVYIDELAQYIFDNEKLFDHYLELEDEEEFDFDEWVEYMKEEYEDINEDDLYEFRDHFQNLDDFIDNEFEFFQFNKNK